MTLRIAKERKDFTDRGLFLFISTCFLFPPDDTTYSTIDRKEKT